MSNDTKRGAKRGVLGTGRAKDLEKTQDADADDDRDDDSDAQSGG